MSSTTFCTIITANASQPVPVTKQWRWSPALLHFACIQHSANLVMSNQMGSFYRRSGIKMRKAPGLCRLRGKPTQARCGAWAGHIPNSEQFWQRAHSIGPCLYGRKRSARSQRRPCRQLSDGCGAQVWSIHEPASPTASLARNHKGLCWQHVRPTALFASMRRRTSWICHNGLLHTMWPVKCHLAASHGTSPHFACTRLWLQ